ncbi:MAG: preprotein translocase subunit SecG [Dongiaceae bacterium]
MESLLTPILLVIHILLAVGLIAVVLLQRSEGGLGGLGGGGMSGFMTTRGSANLLTRTTRWLAGSFMATSLVLAWLAAHSGASRPTIISEPPPIEAPAVPMQDQGGAATGVPAAPPEAGGSETGTAPGAPAVPTNQ